MNPLRAALSRSQITRAVFISGVLLVCLCTSYASADLIHFAVTMSGGQEVPPNSSPGTGSGTATLDTVTNLLSWDFSYGGLQSATTSVAFHGPALPGVNGGVQIGLGAAASPVSGSQVVSAAKAIDIAAGLWYLNIHTSAFPAGEIRGQVLPTGTDQFSVDWFTIDGGGAMNCTGGSFVLDGTIGQPDAGPSNGPMTGGGFELVGGFWTGAGGTATCPLPGDMNGDSLRNGRDIQHFVNCLTAGGSCLCADTNVSGAANTTDIPSFVAFLTS